MTRGEVRSVFTHEDPRQARYAPPQPDALVEHYCETMHGAYERAALGAGWHTNPASRKPWADVPEANKVTMRAAVRALLDEIAVRGEILPAPQPSYPRAAPLAQCAQCDGTPRSGGGFTHADDCPAVTPTPWADPDHDVLADLRAAGKTN